MTGYDAAARAQALRARALALLDEAGRCGTARCDDLTRKALALIEQARRLHCNDDAAPHGPDMRFH